MKWVLCGFAFMFMILMGHLLERGQDKAAVFLIPITLTLMAAVVIHMLEGQK